MKKTKEIQKGFKGLLQGPKKPKQKETQKKVKATFVFPEEIITKVKALAWYSRKNHREIILEALGDHFNNKKHMGKALKEYQEHGQAS